MNSTLYTIVAAAIAALLTGVAAFPFGAPLQACTTRTPHHQENHPANTSCPFEISGYGWIAGQFSPIGIIPGVGFDGVTFKGYIISVFDKRTGQPIGEMRDTEVMKKASRPARLEAREEPRKVCRESSLTHTEASNKTEVYVEWKAPATLTSSDRVEIRATVVQAFDTYWVNCNPFDLPMETVPFSDYLAE